MGAWSKLFSDKNRVKSSFSVKDAAGRTHTIVPVFGAGGKSGEDFADVVREGGATFAQSWKDQLPDGREGTRKDTVKAPDTTPAEADAVARDLLGLPARDVVPEKVRKRSEVLPSENGSHKNGAAPAVK
jgi:hypothetical protein